MAAATAEQKIRRLKIIMIVLIGIIVVLVGLIFSAPASSAESAPQNGTGTAPELVFSDVPKNHPYNQAIESLKAKGIITGFSDGTFLPEKELSRAEAVTLVLKAASIKESPPITGTGTSPFPDVQAGAWYFSPILKAVELKIVRGYGDQTFKPENPVTLAEGIKMLLSAHRIFPQGKKNDEWFAPYLRYAEEKNLADPDSMGHYLATEKLTRGKFAEIIFREEFIKGLGKPFDLTIEWNEFSNPNNFYRIFYPKDWEAFRGTKNSFVWRKDKENGQIWFSRLYPASTRVSMSFLEDGGPPQSFFSDIRKKISMLYPEKKLNIINLTVDSRTALSVDIPKMHYLDLYVHLGGNRYLVFYGEYGWGPLSEFLKKQIRYVEQSFRYAEKPKEPEKPKLTPEQKLELVRENLLVEGKGKEILDLFPDKKLIETDAIGVGTGPVDYYYTKEANVTLKYDRTSKTLLDTREGQTTKF